MERHRNSIFGGIMNAELFGKLSNFKNISSRKIFERDGKRFKRIYCRSRKLKNGKRIYPKIGKLFVFEIENSS